MASVHISAREKRTDTNCSMPNGEIDGEQHYSVWIGAKTEHALQFVEHYINEGWEYVSILGVTPVQSTNRRGDEPTLAGPSRADRVFNPAVEAPHAEVDRLLLGSEYHSNRAIIIHG
jgi:hypothetical protein